MFTRRQSLSGLAASVLVPSLSFGGPASLSLELRSDLAQRFTADGTNGTFAASLIGSAGVVVSDDRRSGQAILPASTFKIPNSIIALETGVVADPDRDVFKWDGVVRSISRLEPGPYTTLGDRRVGRAGLPGDRAANWSRADAEIHRCLRLR